MRSVPEELLLVGDAQHGEDLQHMVPLAPEPLLPSQKELFHRT